MPDMKTLRRLVGFGEPVAGQYLRGVVGLGLVNLGVNGLFALMLAQLSASLVQASRTQLTRSTLLFLGVAILSSVSISFVARSLITGATKIEYRIRTALFAAVNAVTLYELEKRDSGDVLSRMNNDMTQVSELYTGTVQSLALALFYGMGSVVAVICIDWRGGLVIVGLASLTLLVSAAVAKPLSRQGATLQEQKASFLSRMSQVAQGAAVIRSFNLAAWMTAKVLHVSRLQQRAGIRLAATEAVRSTTDPLSLLAPIGLLFYGALRSVADAAFVPRLIALIQMQNGVTMLFTTAAQTLADLQVKLVSGRRVLELIDLQREPDHLVSTSTLTPVPSSGITVRDLSFGYDNGADVVRNVSLDVRSGTTVAVVGPSGGGKSTLFKLLLGLYQPRTGSIAVDGRSIFLTPLSEWRRQFAYVPQNAFLFSDTVYENIVGGMPDPGEEAVRNAAQAANAHDFIQRLPQGYRTVLEESGHNLSGGEKQRIAIARAILQDAPVLLLDEATSALDAESERQVQGALEHLMRGRTTIVIAHRLSTIQTADAIYVLDDGQVAECGTHEMLMGKAGRYRALIEAGLRSPTHQI